MDKVRRSLLGLVVVASALFMILEPAAAASENIGAELAIVWGIPFAGILLSIAVLPLVAHDFWHNHYGKVAAFWALTFVIPFGFAYGGPELVHQVAHTVLLEYIPFIILLFSLFVISGGILVRGDFLGTPSVNVGFLAIGTVLASFIGTTGASMVLIRPLLRANQGRNYSTHVFVFFIFLVSNIGGSLSPLGDPPLFLGFLKGVDFFWPTVNLFTKTLMVSAFLLVVFYILDAYVFPNRNLVIPKTPHPDAKKLEIKGMVNIGLLGCVVAAVLMSGIWKPGIRWEILGTPVEAQNVLRDVLLIVFAGLSMLLTPRLYRKENGFNWEPIAEVAKLFAAIFATIIPVILILRAGTAGEMASVVAAVSTETGEPINWVYFWLTGILSSFLDNAPTYLVFFNIAGGDPNELMTSLNSTLVAISSAAVFMGAMTYIGNAPNFMVRSIVVHSGVKMPTFIGYMGWSIVFLVPPFLFITWLYFI